MIERKQKCHKLKTWPKYFEAILDGSKSFESRYNDRDFKVGDLIVLEEYDPETKQHTSRALAFEISYVLQGCTAMGIVTGYSILGFKDIEAKEARKKILTIMSSIEKDEKDIDVKTIIKQYLITNGYDGLYQEDRVCSCLLESAFMPNFACCNKLSSCKPGYNNRSTIKEEP